MSSASRCSSRTCSSNDWNCSSLIATARKMVLARYASPSFIRVYAEGAVLSSRRQRMKPQSSHEYANASSPRQVPGGRSGRRGAPRSCDHTSGTSAMRRRLSCPRSGGSCRLRQTKALRTRTTALAGCTRTGKGACRPLTRHRFTASLDRRTSHRRCHCCRTRSSVSAADNRWPALVLEHRPPLSPS